jgi:hypothetical protein
MLANQFFPVEYRSVASDISGLFQAAHACLTGRFRQPHTIGKFCDSYAAVLLQFMQD